MLIYVNRARLFLLNSIQINMVKYQRLNRGFLCIYKLEDAKMQKRKYNAKIYNIKYTIYNIKYTI